MKKFLWIFVAAFLFRFLLAFGPWHPDLNNHADWGIRFFEYGPKMFYQANVWSFTWPNQPPGTMYIFAGVRKLFEAVFSFSWWINVHIPAFPSGVITFFEKALYPALLKLPAILADLGIGYLLYKITRKKIASVIWFINPVIWYNSAVWGQYDAVINFFALLAFYLLTRRKITLSSLSFLLCIFIKPSLLIFGPIWLAIAIYQRYKLKEDLISFIACIAVLIMLSLPFSHGNVVTWIYELYKDKVFVQQLHLITANAFNLWSGIAGIHERPETLPFLGLTYQLWGYILFLVSYIPLIIFLVKSRKEKVIYWVLALISLSSFILLTNMHERYLYPLFPYLTILLVTYQINKWYYWVISFIALLNLYNFWWVPRIDLVMNFLSFGNRLMPRILGFINFGFLIYLYSKFLRQVKPVKL